MTYKPGMAKSKKGPRGIGKVQVNKAKGKVRVILVGENKKKEIYDLDMENCPTYVQPGEFKVSLNSDHDIMYGLHPANGMVRVKVNKFLSEEDKPPTPKTEDVSKTEDYPAYSYEYFTVLLEIDQKKFKGMIIPLRLRYHFKGTLEEVKKKEKEVVWYDKPGSKYTPMLVDFCEATGVFDRGPMPWKANILPMMEKRIASLNQSFAIVLKDGWVNTIFTGLETEPDEEELEEEEVDEELDEETDDFDEESEPDEEELDEDLDWEEE